ncbi:YchJ family protein [Corynebacterium ciconiae]|uniref:YchJ family protein n=1 Tax=Corynebacterium ciconiae TaxID=227319 RepID=UPI0003AB1306|nr:YchJ family metal-binding protein [Corynebacterium ciconiae]
MSNHPAQPLAPEKRCPCCSGLSYGDCCGIYHGVDCGWKLEEARPAPTAEALMRSRFSAFAVGFAGYLMATWAPEHRPDEITLDSEETRFYRLDILSSTRGGPMDTEGSVSFAAYVRGPSGREVQREHSLFERRNGRWFYTTGTPVTC